MLFGLVTCLRGANVPSKESYFCKSGQPDDCAKQCSQWKPQQPGELQQLQSCVRLGLMYESGTWVEKKDIPRALELYKRACDADVGYGCLHLGTLYADGTGVTKVQGKASQLFERARKLLKSSCSDDDGPSCRFLATCLGASRPPPRGKTPLLNRPERV